LPGGEDAEGVDAAVVIWIGLVGFGANTVGGVGGMASGAKLQGMTTFIALDMY
jgi:hypothetical protein